MHKTNTWTVDELNTSSLDSGSCNVMPKFWSIEELNSVIASSQGGTRGFAPDLGILRFAAVGSPPTLAEMQSDGIGAALRALAMPGQSILSQAKVDQQQAPGADLDFHRELGTSAAHPWTDQNKLGVPSPPPLFASLVTFRVEPFENNTVLYLRVAPPWKNARPLGMLCFYVIIENGSKDPVTLTKIDITFPGSVQPPVSYTRMNLIPPGKKVEVWPKDAELVMLTTSPTNIVISLVFEGMNDPVSLQCGLGPHQVSYPLFAKPEDINKHGEYVLLPKDHYGEANREVFAYDTSAVGWVDGKLSKTRNLSATNEDYFVFGRPIYSMKSGQVVWATDANVDNPAPGQRAIVKNGATWQNTFFAGDIAVAGMDSTRIVIAWVASGTLKLTVLAKMELPDSLTVLDETIGPAASAVELVKLTSNWAVTATQNGKTMRITLWELTAGGAMIDHLHSDFLDVTAAKLLPLSSKRLVVATYDKASTLTLSVWGIDFINKTMMSLPIGNTNFISQTGVGFDLAMIDGGRFATLTSSSVVLMDLNVVVWKFIETTMNGVTTFMLFPFGKGGGFVGERVGIAVPYADHFGVVVRELNGTMKVLVWRTDPNDGAVTLMSKYERKAPASKIAAVPFKEKTIAILSRSLENRMQITVLNIAQNEKDKSITIQLTNDKNEVPDTTDMFCASLVQRAQPLLVTALRAVNSGGIAKVQLWEFSANNGIHILHGNEVVSYMHLKQGSIPQKFTGNWPVAVKQGELIGLSGNAGSAGAPHLHIHVSRVFDQFLNDYAQLRKSLMASNMEAISVFRPLQFENAKVGNFDNVKEGGAKANPQLSDMNGVGGYYFNFAVLPLGAVIKSP